MPAAFQLSPDQIGKLQNAIKSNCDKPDLISALSRYPGSRAEPDCIPIGNPTFAEMFLVCFKNIEADLQSSFLLRVLDTKWRHEKLRQEALKAADVLVRAPRNVTEAVNVLAAQLQAYIDVLPANPGPGNIGDPVVFAALCDIREPLRDLSQCFAALGGLKGLHDGLHALQVLGARWLDWSQYAQIPAPTPNILGLVRRAHQLADIDDALLGQDGVDCRERCRRVLGDVEALLTSGAADAADFARSKVRNLLMAEMPRIDEIILAASRRLPLKSFSAAFNAISHSINSDVARDATIELADTLLRRLMEHAVWQATDLLLYKLEEFLCDPQKGWFEAVAKILPVVRTNLNAVAGSGNGRQWMTGATSDALTEFERSVSSNAAPQADDAGFTRLFEGFEALRQSVRGNFLEVDQLLKADFDRCSAIQAKIDTLISRIPQWCSLWAPP